MRHARAVALFIFVAACRTSITAAQQSAANGPSLAETLQYIEEKINQNGLVNYAIHVHDNQDGRNWTIQKNEAFTGVVTEPDTCKLSYHWKSIGDGVVQIDADAWFPFTAVANVKVTTVAAVAKLNDAAHGHLTRDATVDPPAYEVVVQKQGNGKNAFIFADEDIANRVAKAMTHAAQLCGGGDQDPFSQNQSPASTPMSPAPDADAQGALLERRAFDLASQKKFDQAYDLYLTDSQMGRMAGQYALGMIYLEGDGRPKDYAQAMYWFQKAAAQGHPAAEGNIGAMYCYGLGVPRDYSQGFSWFQKAAVNGSSTAQFNIGVMYENGMGRTQDLTQAFAWISKAAAESYLPAEYEIGLLYENGRGTAQDYAQALHWYGNAASQGHTGAQVNLGFMYEYAIGVPQNYTQAMYWYQQAAAQGYALAQFNIGYMYTMGFGTPRNDALAMSWYQKAAAQGNADAQTNLRILQQQMAQNAQLAAQRAVAPAPMATPKHSRWSSIFGFVNALATVAYTGMTVSADMNAASHGGGAGAVINAVANIADANNAITNSDDGGNALANLADTLNKINATLDLANNGGYTPNGGPNVNASINECSANGNYLYLKQSCATSTLSQLPCYQAAVSICQCFINAYPAGPDRSQWQACVNHNNSLISALNSSAPTVGTGTIQPRPLPQRAPARRQPTTARQV
jgi:TPR repeat protein